MVFQFFNQPFLRLDICVKLIVIFFYFNFNFPDLSFKRVRPSKVAASCIFAARKTIQEIPDWNETLELITQYKSSDLEKITNHLILKISLKELKDNSIEVVPF